MQLAFSSHKSFHLQANSRLQSKCMPLEFMLHIRIFFIFFFKVTSLSEKLNFRRMKNTTLIKSLKVIFY